MARTQASFIKSLTISIAVAGFGGLSFVASAQQADQGAIQEVVVTFAQAFAHLVASEAADSDFLARLGDFLRHHFADSASGRSATGRRLPKRKHG